MRISVHQPQYIPWLGYFHKIAASDCFVYLDCVQYKAREYQNRNRLRRKDGWMWLSVPVLDAGSRQPISEVRIDNGFQWQRQHAGSLRTWYGRARYFKEHFPFFKDVYGAHWEKLMDLNVAVTAYMLDVLAIRTPVIFESSLKIEGTSTRRIIAICKALKADTYLSGIGGKGYLEEKLFEENGIRLEYQDFTHPVYDQCFPEFVPFMSAVDLIFNCGSASREILLGK